MMWSPFPLGYKPDMPQIIAYYCYREPELQYEFISASIPDPGTGIPASSGNSGSIG